MIPVAVVASHTAGLGVIRALGREKVPLVAFYYDPQDMGYVSKFVQRSYRVPHPEHDEEQFVDRLLAYGTACGRTLLIPTDDPTLKAVSKNKHRLGQRFAVACADWEITEKIVNKKYTYELAERCGIPMPKTYLPRSRSELEEYARLTGYPCLVKPCQSHQYVELLGRKMVKVADASQLQRAFAEAREAGIEVMLQEYIPGDDSLNANYNSYFRDGAPLVEFTAQKVRVHPTGFGVPCVVRSRYIPELLAPGRTLLRALGYYGYSCTEFKRDPRDGVYKLMEINARHNRSTLLSVHCGLNFPWLHYRHLLYGELPQQESYREDVYWIDEVKDAVHFLCGVGRHLRGVGRYLEPYGREHVCSIFDGGDLRPIRKRLADLLVRCLPAVHHERQKMELANDDAR